MNTDLPSSVDFLRGEAESRRLADLLLKKDAEVRALQQQLHELPALRAELGRCHEFVRLCAMIFPALDGMRPQHERLWVAIKARRELPDHRLAAAATSAATPNEPACTN